MHYVYKEEKKTANVWDDPNGSTNALRSPSQRSNFELPKYTLVPFPTEHSTQQLLRAESTWRTKVTCCDFKFHHAECNFQTADDCLLSENLPFGVKVTGNQFRSWSESSQRYGFSLTGQKKSLFSVLCFSPAWGRPPFCQDSHMIVLCWQTPWKLDQVQTRYAFILSSPQSSGKPYRRPTDSLGGWLLARWQPGPQKKKNLTEAWQRKLTHLFLTNLNTLSRMSVLRSTSLCRSWTGAPHSCSLEPQVYVLILVDLRRVHVAVICSFHLHHRASNSCNMQQWGFQQTVLVRAHTAKKKVVYIVYGCCRCCVPIWKAVKFSRAFSICCVVVLAPLACATALVVFTVFTCVAVGVWCINRHMTLTWVLTAKSKWIFFLFLNVIAHSSSLHEPRAVPGLTINAFTWFPQFFWYTLQHLSQLNFRCFILGHHF